MHTSLSGMIKTAMRSVTCRITLPLRQQIVPFYRGKELWHKIQRILKAIKQNYFKNRESNCRLLDILTLNQFGEITRLVIILLIW
jgi:hypothetical protein